MDDTSDLDSIRTSELSSADSQATLDPNSNNNSNINVDQKQSGYDLPYLSLTRTRYDTTAMMLELQRIENDILNR